MNLSDIFEYDPFSETYLVNKVTRGIRAPEGAPSGTKSRGGYFTKVNGVSYQNSRIIWELHHGPVPDDLFVCFKDGNCFNLSINNLILVNRKIKSLLAQYNNNISGERGVSVRYLDNGEKRYHAYLRNDGVNTYLGSFKTLREASASYRAALKMTINLTLKTINRQISINQQL